MGVHTSQQKQFILEAVATYVYDSKFCEHEPTGYHESLTEQEKTIS